MVKDRLRDPKEVREPLQCWRCGENHMRWNCLLDNGYVRKVHNIQGAKTMGQVARTVPRIYAALEDHQEEH